jgi:hypothetical protein
VSGSRLLWPGRRDHLVDVEFARFVVVACGTVQVTMTVVEAFLFPQVAVLGGDDLVRCRCEKASAGEDADESPVRHAPCEPAAVGEHGGGQCGEHVTEFGGLSHNLGQDFRGEPGGVLDTLPVQPAPMVAADSA